MPIVINNIKSGLSADSSEVITSALRAAGIGRAVKATVYKTSLDARKRSDIHYVHSVYAELSSEEEERDVVKRCSDAVYVAPCSVSPVFGTSEQEGRVCIAGFGPAGMFCALVLAENGYSPIVFERGGDVDSRVKAVSGFWKGGALDTESNVQFGEGGAGTFSDGKLTTRIKDPLCRYVLEQFVRFGAPEEILSKAKPHIGTDKLRGIVKKIRERVIELGGEVRFLSPVEDIDIIDSRVASVRYRGGSESCSALVMATGHSARDTFEMLAGKGVFLEPKPFSVGVRIEHKQRDVDESLYGKFAGEPLLPKGEYQLSAKDSTGRAVYTFCMCPGGVVVPAASEENSVVTNGMSEFARDGENANAAIAVAVSPKDYGISPLDGMYFARSIEQRAFKLTGSYKAPATSVRGFFIGKAELSGSVTPSYARGVLPVELDKLFPKNICDALRYGLHDFSRKMKCFGSGDAMLTAPETRTSSPVRITRGEKLNSLTLENLFPCGEGAGYAGGIMSAAVDGIKVALEIMSRFAPK
ncbi:MAG: NAD(P)/FAD-dependent oxidoreductase [Ruminococcus sp.]|nr:NAD(P)/FAD-dependent oxidoreductase [Ruminococcus sp.]